MPRFGGRGEPGETVFLDIDGDTYHGTTDADGFWDISAPELDDGDHDFELWTESSTGDRSSAQEWQTNVSANDDDRAAQRDRNSDWARGGRDNWRADNGGLTSTPVSAGGGGTGGQGGGGGGAGGGAGTAAGGQTETPAGDFEKGNSPGG